MTPRQPSERYEWDDRNDVAIRRVASADELDHEAVRSYEFVVPSPSGGRLDVIGLYDPKPTETLIVTFHGSLQRTKYHLPRFEWRRSLEGLGVAFLSFADTTLELSEKIPLGWYVGTEEQDLASDIATVIRQVAKDANHRRILLAGSSGGGYAAMAVSHRIPDSVAVSFSPQTRIADYYPWVQRGFVRAAFPSYDTIDEVESTFPGRVSLQELYGDVPTHNYVRYIQNSRDPAHIERHYAPLAIARSVDPAEGGIDASGRLRFLLEPMSQGHQPPSRRRFLQNIEEAHQEFFGTKIGASNQGEEELWPRSTAALSALRSRLRGSRTRR